MALNDWKRTLFQSIIPLSICFHSILGGKVLDMDKIDLFSPATLLLTKRKNIELSSSLDLTLSSTLHLFLLLLNSLRSEKNISMNTPHLERNLTISRQEIGCRSSKKIFKVNQEFQSKGHYQQENQAR